MVGGWWVVGWVVVDAGCARVVWSVVGGGRYGGSVVGGWVGFGWVVCEWSVVG